MRTFMLLLIAIILIAIGNVIENGFTMLDRNLYNVTFRACPR